MAHYIDNGALTYGRYCVGESLLMCGSVNTPRLSVTPLRDKRSQVSAYHVGRLDSFCSLFRQACNESVKGRLHVGGGLKRGLFKFCAGAVVVV